MVRRLSRFRRDKSLSLRLFNCANFEATTGKPMNYSTEKSFLARHWIALSAALLLAVTLNCSTVVSTAAPAVKEVKPKKAPPITLSENIAIAPVWAGHPVGFALLTHNDQQFVAFYDAERNMTIGQRTLGDKAFKLDEIGFQSRLGFA